MVEMTQCTTQMRHISIVSICYWPTGNAQYHDKEQAYEAPVLHTCISCYFFLEMEYVPSAEYFAMASERVRKFPVDLDI